MYSSTLASLRIRRAVILFFCCIVLILLRVWQLSILEHQKYLEESLKPQRRLVIEAVERAPIYDRFHIPLAVNQTQYQVAVCYGELKNIARVVWEKDAQGKPLKILARSLYLKSLSKFLGKMLEMDPLEIEDLIQGEAALFPNTPLVLKENLSEELYARLKLVEKDWVGLRAQRIVKRVYPQGKVGCHVIGYIGTMGQAQYRQIAEELSSLRGYLEAKLDGKAVILPEGFSSIHAVENRIEELEHLSYSINDEVGKSGIEALFDERLKGVKGKKWYEVDVKGHLVTELEGGQLKQIPEPFTLTLSAELQLEAEKLLLEYEHLQDKIDENPANAPHRVGEKPTGWRHHSWQRGGAIVAMNPKTGEVLALASTPRFDPNDFVPSKKGATRKEKKSHIDKWLENESYIGEIWEGKRGLEREVFSAETKTFCIESTPFTWQIYLDRILSSHSAVYAFISKIKTVGEALVFQKKFSLLHPALQSMSSLHDKFLSYDLLCLVANYQDLSLELEEHLKELPLSTFFHFSQLVNQTVSMLEQELKPLYHKTLFKEWREEHFKEFLKGKRKEEKEQRRYARPYTYYLEREEKALFSAFWNTYRYHFVMTFILGTQEEELPLTSDILALKDSHPIEGLSSLREFLSSLSPSLALSYLESVRSFAQLTLPLQESYPRLKKENGIQLQKHLAAAFYPQHGLGFIRSEAFQTSTPMGSIFKLIPSYTALHAQEKKGDPISNPLTLTDQISWNTKPGSFRQVLGRFENGEPIYRLHNGAILPRGYSNMGTLDLYKAIERSSNLYFSILAGDIVENPHELLDACDAFGLGSLTEIDLPGEYQGFVPLDILHNKTSLYSFAIGQHALVATPLQAARAFSALANRGILFTPYLAKEKPPTKKPSFIPMSNELQTMLLQGMSLVINGERGSARQATFHRTSHNKEGLAALRKLGPYLCGKTGTAEILHKDTIESETAAWMEKHVWFASLSFRDLAHQDPELVVLVYLPFGSAGRQGAPMAALLTQKWREIAHKHRQFR